MPTHQQLVNLALVMKLTPNQAIALPATVEVAAKKVGWTQEALFKRIVEDKAVRDYIRDVCIDVMEKETL